MNNQQTDKATIGLEIQTVGALTGSTDIALNDVGWDSRVYSVDNGRYYFKFPRTEEVRKSYIQEIAVLNMVAEIDAVRVPRVRWQHPTNEYFGYEGVRGELLNDIVFQLTDERKAHIGIQIGAFLRTFHGKSLHDVRAQTLEGEIAQFQAFYKLAAETIKRSYTRVEQRSLSTLVYKTWPERIRSLGSVNVLSHGDLHLSNILFDEHEGLGIIDFGDTALYDESRDLIDLEDLVIEQAAFEGYGISHALQDKIAARKPSLQLISLAYHINKGHSHDVQRYLDKIRSYL